MCLNAQRRRSRQGKCLDFSLASLHCLGNTTAALLGARGGCRSVMIPPHPERPALEGHGAQSAHTIRVAGSEKLGRSFSLLCTSLPQIPPSQLPPFGLLCPLTGMQGGMPWIGAGGGGGLRGWGGSLRGKSFLLLLGTDSAGERMRKHRDSGGWGSGRSGWGKGQTGALGLWKPISAFFGPEFPYR